MKRNIVAPIDHTKNVDTAQVTSVTHLDVDDTTTDDNNLNKMEIEGLALLESNTALNASSSSSSSSVPHIPTPSSSSSIRKTKSITGMSSMKSRVSTMSIEIFSTSEEKKIGVRHI